MPVATGKTSRVSGIVLKNVRHSTFEEFSNQYREKVDEALIGTPSALSPPDLFFLAHNLNNLPNLRFTGIKPHRGTVNSTHVWWSLGKREDKEGSCTVPMMIRMHHANGDPVILKALMDSFDLLHETSNF